MGIFRKLFNKKVEPPPPKDESVAGFIKRTNEEAAAKYDFLTFKVAGVTFKNGRKTRQAVLRKIKFREPPFDKTANISIRPSEFEGEQSYEIYANEEQIGNVPKEHVEFLRVNWSRRDTITNIDVRGGGMTETGERRNYGAEITIRFFKEPPKVK